MLRKRQKNLEVHFFLPHPVLHDFSLSREAVVDKRIGLYKCVRTDIYVCISLCGRPNRPQYRSCPSVCPVVAPNSKNKRHKTKQEAQPSLGQADRTVYVQSPASDFQSHKESDLSEVRQFHARYVNGTLSRKLQ